MLICAQVYAAQDVHMDPQIYKEPHEWDPSRHDKARAEGTTTPHAFLGWGSGNHPCREYPEHVTQTCRILDRTDTVGSYSGYEGMCDRLRLYGADKLTKCSLRN